MTVQKIALGVHRYTGLAGDTKPTSVPPGSTFLATDTQALYITYDGTNWVLKDATGEVQTSPTSNTLLYRLKALLTGIVLAAGAAIIGKVRHVTATGDEITNDTLDAMKTVESFGGATYVNQDTAVSDAARRFETTSTKLRDVLVKVSTYAQLFGTSASQTFRVEPGGTWAVGKIDVSTLYFKNATAGENGTVDILAVAE